MDKEKIIKRLVKISKKPELTSEDSEELVAIAEAIKLLDVDVSDYLASIGSKGGQKKTEAKAEAARRNGLLGGRPVSATRR